MVLLHLGGNDSNHPFFHVGKHTLFFSFCEKRLQTSIHKKKNFLCFIPVLYCLEPFFVWILHIFVPIFWVFFWNFVLPILLCKTRRYLSNHFWESCLLKVVQYVSFFLCSPKSFWCEWLFVIYENFVVTIQRKFCANVFFLFTEWLVFFLWGFSEDDLSWCQNDPSKLTQTISLFLLVKKGKLLVAI